MNRQEELLDQDEIIAFRQFITDNSIKFQNLSTCSMKRKKAIVHMRSSLQQVIAKKIEVAIKKEIKFIQHNIFET